MSAEKSPAQMSWSEIHRVAYLKWRDAPPGMSPALADEFMAKLKAGSTVRKLTGGGKILGPALVSYDRFKKHCELHPNWGAEAWRTSKINCNLGKGARLRKMTEKLCLRGLHPMTGDNVRIDPSRGRRACLACRNMARDNPPLIVPDVLVKIKRALESGATIAQICYGRPIGGGAGDRGAKLVNSHKFYHHRRIDPAFNRFVLAHVADSTSIGQRARWRRVRTRAQTEAARTATNDYHAIRALIPTTFPDRDDVVARIFEDILSGAIRREDVRSRIKHYITEHNRMFPTNFAKFGDSPLVSLDEMIFDDGSTTRGDTVSRGLWD
jgi:hypothetical protein